MRKGPRLRMVKISKSFGAVRALHHVDFEVNYGEIVGLVGDNGAGKSTLMKILTGAYLLDEGEIFFEGERVNFNNPMDSRNAGIEMIYQDLALGDEIDILGNIFMGRELARNFLGRLLKVVDVERMEVESWRTLRTLDINVSSVKTKVGNLSGGQRKAVAIARTIYWEAKLIVMDEPTAALGVKEVYKVLELIRGLKKKGVSIVFISHNLQEIFATVDRVFVLRSGDLAGVRRIKDTTPEEVVKLMVGAGIVGQ